MSNKITAIKIVETAPVITGNFDEVKESLEAQLMKYEKLVVTEENLTDAKAIQKELGTIRREIDGRRLDITRNLKAPIEAFAAQMKELLGLVFKVEDPIKTGIAVFTQKEKDARLKRAKEIIAESIERHGLTGRYADMVAMDDSFLLKAASAKKINEAVEANCQRALLERKADEDAVKVIEMTVDAANEKHGLVTKLVAAPYIKQVVEDGWALATVLTNINAAAEKMAESEQAVAEKVSAENTTIAPEPPKSGAQQPKTRSVTICITTTDAKLTALQEYLKANSIGFQKVG